MFQQMTAWQKKLVLLNLELTSFGKKFLCWIQSPESLRKSQTR
jgi:hypothetical protein